MTLCGWIYERLKKKGTVVIDDDDKTPLNPVTRLPLPNDDDLVRLPNNVVVRAVADLPLSTRLSKHFTYAEMVRSQTAARKGIDNTPDFASFKAGVKFANTLLEPLREEFGPVYPSSWYRCPELNLAIGGSKTSAHMDCVALDHTTQATLQDEMAWWIDGDLPFDQVIYEFGRWIHVGGPKLGQEPRRQALMIFSGTKYLLYDAKKIDASGTKLK